MNVLFIISGALLVLACVAIVMVVMVTDMAMVLQMHRKDAVSVRRMIYIDCSA